MDSLDKSAPARISQTHDHQPTMAAWRIPADIGKVEILCDEETLSLLSGIPDGLIVSARQPFLGHCIDSVRQICEARLQPSRDIFI